MDDSGTPQDVGDDITGLHSVSYIKLDEFVFVLVFGESITFVVD